MITETVAEYPSNAGSTKKTPLASYEVSFVNICEKIDHIITAPLYMLRNICTQIESCLDDAYKISGYEVELGMKMPCVMLIHSVHFVGYF